MMYYLDKELLKFLMQDDICLFVVCVNVHSNASHSCALAQMTSYSLPFVVIVFWTSSVATQLLFVAQQSV